MGEIVLNDDAFLVSETDINGNIKFANDDFVKVSGYTKNELLGQPHNIIRNPDMPAAAFKSLWETVESGKVWNGFVKNRSKNGDFYWVYATVYPMIGCGGDEGGYMSCRVKATKEEILAAEELYRGMK